MNLKKFLDAANAAEARVQSIAAQIDEHFEANETEKALEMKPQLDSAKDEAKKAYELYTAMVNATSGGSDPARQLVQNGSGVQVVKDEADQDFESDGQFFQAVKTAALYPGRMDARLRSRKFVDATGMSEGVPADGGYLLRPETAAGILQNMWQTGQILPLVSHDPVTGNTMIYNGVDETSRVNGSRNGGITSYWLGEGSTITASKPKFRQVELKLKKVGAFCYATDEQLEDTANLESWLNRTVPDELVFRTEDAIVEGDGVGKPLGILNSPALVSVTRQDASKVQYADIVGMWARRYAGVNDYVWLVNQDVTPQLDSLVMSTDIPVRFVNYGVNNVMTIKGRPVLEVEYCQTLGTVGDILLASMSQYQAIDKGAAKAASSIHVAFTTDEMAYRFIYRVDAKPLWYSPVTPLHGTNTVSPFVALTTAT